MDTRRANPQIVGADGDRGNNRAIATATYPIG
jgi:hypothetical protein